MLAGFWLMMTSRTVPDIYRGHQFHATCLSGENQLPEAVLQAT